MIGIEGEKRRLDFGLHVLPVRARISMMDDSSVLLSISAEKSHLPRVHTIPTIILPGAGEERLGAVPWFSYCLRTAHVRSAM